MNFKELDTKISISLGLVLFLIIASWFVSDFYHNQITLEERMDKRYERTQEKIKAIQDERKISK